ncbi:MAG TPA: 2-oxoglutarate dehydrogenase, E2 component, dihydrolipoamide succinyltransferase [Actinomycetes bacterium]|nr:2-oxoglutarate dehydrogenase, E2 component, dihydrolipoamide succinyltransferase [Actinomycetes bacterium]
MAVSVTMPQLGESVTEGTVTRWLKAEGDDVEADEPLLEVSTDKVDTEIPAPASGTLLRIVAGEDEVVQVGAELAVIGDPSEGSTPAAPPREAAAVRAAEEAAPAAEEQAPARAEGAPTEKEAPAPSAETVGATPVLLPALGESVTEGTVTRWLKKVGDQVEADEPLVEISTDKVDTEIPSPASGVLLAIRVGEDETVAVGSELAVIGGAGTAPAAAEPVPAAPAATPTPAPPPGPAPTPAPAPPPPAPAAVAAPAPAPAVSASAPSRAAEAAGDETYVTPLVRKLAAEHDVDLATVHGTGVGGRIRKQDVLDAAAAAKAAAAAASPAPGPVAAAPASATTSPLRGRTEKMSRLRAVIAARMVESLHTTAQLTTVVEVDVSRIAAARQRAKRDFESREGVKLSFLPFFAKAAVEALKVHPALNASIDTEAGTITYHDAEHLGIAVDTDRGLLVPVIRDAGDLNIGGLARRIADLAERTRGNKITPDELSGGTFTLTNTGSRGALFDTPILNLPQVAILGTGAVVKRAVVVSDDTGADSIAIRSMVYLALTYDHRLVDGADAARFLATVKTRLEDGSFEAELGL